MTDYSWCCGGRTLPIAIPLGTECPEPWQTPCPYDYYSDCSIYCNSLWQRCCNMEPSDWCEDEPPVYCQYHGGRSLPGYCGEFEDPCGIDPTTQLPCCLGQTCSMRTVENCRNAGGSVAWGYNSCSPNPCALGDIMGCCLCNHQCEDIQQELCETLHGKYTTGLMCWEGGHDWCAQYHPNVKPPCASARFSLARDTLRANGRFCPVSIDSMNPHEYTVNPADRNCRIQFAAVDSGGAWTCGQWERTDPTTNTNYRLSFSLDANGRGMWWVRYLEYCYNY